MQKFSVWAQSRHLTVLSDDRSPMLSRHCYAHNFPVSHRPRGNGIVLVVISIDQEGGTVSRMGPFNGFSEWVSASELSQSGRSNAEILAYYSERALEMVNVGINLNLGPVVDLNTNPFNPIIGSKGRAYGRSVEEVVRFAELFVRAHHSAGVKTCLKHCPGHGSSMEDMSSFVTS